MSTAELLAQGPLASHHALALVHPLATTAAELHRRGEIAGLGDPGRVRVLDGVPTVGSAGADLGNGAAEDVRGLGALLYLLTTGFWPLRSNSPPGSRPAPRRPDGTAVPPDVLRPDVAVEVAELAMAALATDRSGPAARLRTASGMARVIEELSRDWTVDLLPPMDGTGSDLTWSFENDAAPAPGDPDAGRKLSLGMTALAGVALLTFGLVGTQAASALGLLPTDGPPPIVVANSSPATPGAVPASPVAQRTPDTVAPQPGPAGTQPDSTRPDSTQPDSTQPDSTRPDSTQLAAQPAGGAQPGEAATRGPSSRPQPAPQRLRTRDGERRTEGDSDDRDSDDRNSGDSDSNDHNSDDRNSDDGDSGDE